MLLARSVFLSAIVFVTGIDTSAQVISEQRARLLLLADAKAEGEEEWSVKWRDRCDSLTNKDAHAFEISSWEVHGHPVSGPGRWFLLDQASGTRIRHVMSWRDGFNILSTPKPGFCDSLIRPHEEFQVRSFSPVMQYCRPIGKKPWVAYVESAPIAVAENLGDGLEVIFLAHEEIFKAAEAGRSVMGLVGYRCTSRRLEGRLRLVKIEHLESVKVRKEGKGVIPNGAIMEDQKRVEVLGSIACGVTRIRQFEDFKSCGNAFFPTVHRVRTNRGSYLARVDGDSVAALPPDVPVIELKPPQELGRVGRMLDTRTMSTSYTTDGQVDGKQLIMNMVAAGAGAEVGEKGRAPFLWYLLPGVALAILASVFLFRRSRRLRIQGHPQ